MTHHDHWRTVGVTPLTPGVVATAGFDGVIDGDEADWQWPAVALLHQTRGDDERIVLGILHPTGTVEPCYQGRSDDDPNGLDLVDLDYGPYRAVAQPDTAQ
jgi:hypothetical protein